MNLFRTLAEGGQTWAHRVRMVRQVIKIALNFSLLIAAIIFVINISKIGPRLFQGSWYYAKAHTLNLFGNDTSVSKSYWESMTRERTVSANRQVPAHQLIQHTKPQASLLLKLLQLEAKKSLKICPWCFSIVLLFFFIRGQTSKRKQHISGKRIVYPFLLKLTLIIKKKASPIKIASLPMVKNTETQHTLVTGGTGSGKTNCFHQMLPQLRQNGHKALIIDTTGHFVEKYYDPDLDFILNPLDKRSSPWNPWVECDNLFDYDSLADSFIPQSLHDQENYWRIAAKSVLSSLMVKTMDLKRTSELTNWLLRKPLEDLADFLQGTNATAHIDLSSAKTAASIRSVASTFLKGLDHLQDTSTPFSINNWCTNEKESGWLFLSCQPSQRSAIIPLISCWFSIAVRGLFHLKSDFNRRIWFVVDELPTLRKLKELETLVSEGRKYGACGLFALQSPSQLEEIYGRATAQTIIGNCGTRVIFSEYDPEVADKISRSIGESEIKEYQEGISYGAHEIRDGVNLSLQTKKMPIISVTDIQSLEKNRAFVKLPGDFPITKLKIPICT